MCKMTPDVPETEMATQAKGETVKLPVSRSFNVQAHAQSAKPAAARKLPPAPGRVEPEDTTVPDREILNKNQR
jgi:hypothetical protein